MKRHLVETLCCPACRVAFEVRALRQTAEDIQTALLTCPRCCITVPLLRGFAVFQRQLLNAAPVIEELETELFGHPGEYLSFLQKKRDKPVYDLYAAFQPFNESTQCIFPLFALLKERLNPGDIILDLWCRTGWTGEMLAANFPEQQVISVWESTSGLMGLKGFDFWLASGKRRANLDILIHSPNQPLPFPDRMFAIVHGLDTLHRYHHMPLISECLRVVHPGGAIVFPHNHLTNSQPEPYFDRGEDQMHGKEYEEFFGRLLQSSRKRAFVLSEKTLFDADPEYKLIDEADTPHYNACILIFDREYEGTVFTRTPKIIASHEDAFVVINPLWKLDLVSRTAEPDPGAMDSGGSTLFFRHPIYRQRMLQHSPIHLEEEDCLILYWAQQQRSIKEIAELTHLSSSRVLERALKLESRELVQTQNISRAMAQLQSYYCTQEVPWEGQQATLTALWQRAVQLHAEKPMLLWPSDDSVFTYEDVDTIVRMAASFLLARGIRSGDRILIDAASHPEFFFLFWACIVVGAVAVPVNPEASPAVYEAIKQRSKPALVLCNAKRQEPEGILFGVPEDSPDYEESFSARVTEFEPLRQLPPAAETQPAAILFTSGSTGTPKGVALSHGGLFRSALIMDRAYGWHTDDRFLSGGNFHTMSGLRNPCIAILHSGASAVIPGKENMQNPLSVMNLCTRYNVTLLNVTPAFLAYWSLAPQKAKFYSSHHIRMILSTGSALQAAHRALFEELFGAPVYDYYGLTETTGACILENSAMHGMQEKGIGRPWGCLVRIVGENGETQPTGASGELAIYTANVMSGYFGEPELTAQRIRNGWLMTGDTARINDAGCVVLTGRRDRMMIDRNGENVYPEEIERALCGVPGIADAYVTQMRDDRGIDVIAAVVQVGSGETTTSDEWPAKLRSALADRIPQHHVPAWIETVSEIPKGPSGKPSAGAVRQILQLSQIRRS